MKQKPRKVTHSKLGPGRYQLKFRGAVLGDVHQVKNKTFDEYTFYPLDRTEKVEKCMTMKGLKIKVLDSIPPDPPPAPGMPCVDA